jgi:hypothetical protein
MPSHTQVRPSVQAALDLPPVKACLGHDVGDRRPVRKVQHDQRSATVTVRNRLSASNFCRKRGSLRLQLDGLLSVLDSRLDRLNRICCFPAYRPPVGWRGVIS